MRKLIIIFLSISLLSACNNKKESRDERRTESDDYRNKDDDKKSDDKETRYANDNENKDNTSDDRRSGGGWKSNEVSIFVDNCVSEAVKGGMQNSKATDYCECMQRKLEVLYPNAEDVAGINTESDDMQAMIRKCLGM